MKYKKTIIYIISIFISILLLFFVINFLKNKRVENVDFWTKNQCRISKPSGIVLKDKVSNFSSSLYLDTGIFVERFHLNGLSYRLVQSGCNDISVKFLIPIKKLRKGDRLDESTYQYLIKNLKKLEQVLAIDFARKTIDILKDPRNKDNIRYNFINYPTCNPGMCDTMVTVFKPVYLDNEYYIPVEYISIL